MDIEPDYLLVLTWLESQLARLYTCLHVLCNCQSHTLNQPVGEATTGTSIASKSLNHMLGLYNPVQRTSLFTNKCSAPSHECLLTIAISSSCPCSSSSSSSQSPSQGPEAHRR